MDSFFESQQLKNNPIRYFFYGVTLFGLLSIALFKFTGCLKNIQADDQIGLLITAVIFLFISGLFMVTKLETRIDENGIHVKFFPFIFRWRTYSWETIEKIYVRDCQPLWEFGGWGYRIGIMGQGNALILSGKTGIQLELKSRKKMFIGTKRKADIEQIIAYYQSLKR
jgi:hypothetical protein